VFELLLFQNVKTRPKSRTLSWTLVLKHVFKSSQLTRRTWKIKVTVYMWFFLSFLMLKVFLFYKWTWNVKSLIGTSKKNVLVGAHKISILYTSTMALGTRLTRYLNAADMKAKWNCSPYGEFLFILDPLSAWLIFLIQVQFSIIVELCQINNFTSQADRIE
jgi:hypothetical protein